MLEDKPLKFSKSTEYEINPFETGAQNIIDKLTALRKKGLEADERMLDCTARMSCQKYSKLFLSEIRIWSRMYCGRTARCHS